MGISSAFFSPGTGNRVVTVGYGSTSGLSKLRLYDTSDENLTKHYGKNYLEPYERIGYASSTGQTVTQHRVSTGCIKVNRSKLNISEPQSLRDSRSNIFFKLRCLVALGDLEI